MYAIAIPPVHEQQFVQDMPVDEEEAKKISRKQIELLQYDDPLFETFTNAIEGYPVMVKNVFRQPSYWLVPFLKEQRVAGFVRVLLDGKIVHIGTFDEFPSDLQSNPTVVTKIESSQAFRMATERLHKEVETASEPVFVHDGPIGREAWLVEVSSHGKPTRWIFVTGEGIYERRAGLTLDSTLE